MKSNKNFAKVIALVVAALLALLLYYCGIVPGGELGSLTEQNNTPTTAAQSPAGASAGAEENAAFIAELYANEEDDVQIRGEGIVSKVLSDDTSGSKHQRFILELSNGMTLLVAHNIDLAPRLDGLVEGDTVEFYGEYYYNEQGGGVHWTHKDPGGKHVDGWLLWSGTYYW